MPLDKYLPEVTEATSVADADLIYTTGSDYKVTAQNMRKLLNPAQATVSKSFSYSVTVEDCDDGWFGNNNAFASIEFILPAAADDLTVGFLVESNKNLVITPQVTERIAFITTVDGQSIRESVVGNSIYLRATGNNWYVVSKTGTWAAV